MKCITAWWHVVKVFSFVKEEEESCSIHSCDVVLRYTIEHQDKSLEHGCVCSDHLSGGGRAREQLKWYGELRQGLPHGPGCLLAFAEECRGSVAPR